MLTACSSKPGSTGTEATAAAAGAAKGSAPSPAAANRPDSAWSAFARLMEGNKRWVAGKLQHPDQDPQRRGSSPRSRNPTA